MTHSPSVHLTDYELQLDGHARAIGHVCIAWSHMELMLDLLIAELIAGEGRLRDRTLVGECVTANADIRDKAQMAIALGHVRKPNDEWFSKLERCMNKINYCLRNLRNRLIHDVWAIHDPPLRIHRRTKITKPQARQRELSTSELVSVHSDEIWALHSDIKGVIEDDHDPTLELSSPRCCAMALNMDSTISSSE